LTAPVDVLDWLDTTAELPRSLTLERTTTSRYMFSLLIRHYHQTTRLKPQHYVYTKETADALKGQIEEHSIFDRLGAVYVLEGFSRRWVDSLHPPEKTYILAETDGGYLSSSPFFKKKDGLRPLVKILTRQLSLKAILPPSFLLRFDWSPTQAWEDVEPILTRAKWLGHTVDSLEAAYMAWWNTLPPAGRSSPLSTSSPACHEETSADEHSRTSSSD
jgi:hypothetical protein